MDEQVMNFLPGICETAASGPLLSREITVVVGVDICWNIRFFKQDVLWVQWWTVPLQKLCIVNV